MSVFKKLSTKSNNDIQRVLVNSTPSWTNLSSQDETGTELSTLDSAVLVEAMQLYT